MIEQKAGEALRQLAEELEAVWRVLPDGEIWIGQESWPEVSPERDLISEDPRGEFAEFGTDSPTLLPGTVLDGKRVSVVEHRIEPESVRTLVWYESEEAADDGDQMTRAISAIVQGLTAHVDYYALYPAKVVSQNDDGTLELRPDDTRLPGLSKIPIRYGIPGLTAKVAAGARILLGFEGGNPHSPIATLWESASVTEIQLSIAAGGKVNIVAGANGSVNVETGAGGEVNIVAADGTATVDAQTVKIGPSALVQLAGGGLGVARMADPVQAGPFAGTITKGSTLVTAGG